MDTRWRLGQIRSLGLRLGLVTFSILSLVVDRSSFLTKSDALKIREMFGDGQGVCMTQLS